MPASRLFSKQFVRNLNLLLSISNGCFAINWKLLSDTRQNGLSYYSQKQTIGLRFQSKTIRYTKSNALRHCSRNRPELEFANPYQFEYQKHKFYQLYFDLQRNL